MKQIKTECESLCLKHSPPPTLLLPRPGIRRTGGESITNKQIEKFWRQKQIIEEDHLFAAIKAAARVRARKLTEEEYERFEESLEVEKLSADNVRSDGAHVGIKDWWTKSKYAYLNQPVVGSADSIRSIRGGGRRRRRRVSSYVPNCFTFKPTIPLYATSLNVF